MLNHPLFVGKSFNPFLVSSSAWFDGEADYLTRNFGVANSTRKVMLSVWTLKTEIGGTVQPIIARRTGSGGAQSDWIGFNTDDTVTVRIGSTENTSIGRLDTVATYRSIGWYHIVVSIDTTEATADNRIRIWVNGEEQVGSLVESRINPSLNFDFNFFNDTGMHEVGRLGPSTAASNYFTGYIAQCLWLDGATIQDGSYEINDFGTTQAYGKNGTGWAAKSDVTISGYASTEGGVSFCLTDAIGNGIDNANENNFTATSMSHSANGSDNSPSNPHCIWNILDTSGSSMMFQNGAFRATGVGADSDGARGTIYLTNGKWYFEFKRDADSGGSDRYRVGVANSLKGLDTTSTLSPNAWTYSENGKKIGGGVADTSYGDMHTSGDCIGVALNLDIGAIWFSKNGVWQNGASVDEIESGATTNAAFTNLAAETVTPYADFYSIESATLRTSLDKFEGAPPTGFDVIAQANLVTPMYQGADLFAAIPYTGDGVASISGGHTITGAGFSPDLVWVQEVGAVGGVSQWYDRLTGVKKKLKPAGSDVVSTEPEGLLSFSSDGFTVGSNSEVNNNADPFGSWLFQFGGAAILSEDGDINSQISAHSSGYGALVEYVGSSGAVRSVAHGMGGTPEFIVVKNKTKHQGWPVYHFLNTSQPETDYLLFNQTIATADDESVWGDTVPDETTFSIGSSSLLTNTTDDVFIAMLLRSIPGVCKIGAYTGDATVNGPYIQCGFLPRVLLLKRTTGSGREWHLYDRARSPYNPVSRVVLFDGAFAEISSGKDIDFLPDGFKLRTNNADINSVNPYVFLAIADLAGGGSFAPVLGV